MCASAVARCPSCHAAFRVASDAITLHFTLTAEGQVTDTLIRGATDPDVRDCLSRILTSWHFQPAAEAIQVNDPIRFVRTARPAPPRPGAPASMDISSSVGQLPDLAFDGNHTCPG